MDEGVLVVAWKDAGIGRYMWVDGAMVEVDDECWMMGDGVIEWLS